MLEGVTILNQTEVWDQNLLFAILASTAIFSGIITLILLASGCFIHSMISGFIFIASIIIIIWIPKEYKYNFLGNSYEVIIDDSVSINEVADQFIIKEHRGDIWILEDKQNKERE